MLYFSFFRPRQTARHGHQNLSPSGSSATVTWITPQGVPGLRRGFNRSLPGRVLVRWHGTLDPYLGPNRHEPERSQPIQLGQAPNAPRFTVSLVTSSQGKAGLSFAAKLRGTAKMSLFGGPKSRRLRQLTLFVLVALIATSSESIAKPRKQQYGNPTAAMPEDPQAYAMRIARQTWPGRALWVPHSSLRY
jgi:hypothetical protein